MRVAVIALVVLAIAGAIVLATARPDTPAAATTGPVLPPTPARARAAVANERNIARGDYIGPDACGECHPDQHARWQHSLHAVMNQRATTEDAVIGDWNGHVVAYAGGQARFDRDRDGYLMTLRKADREVRYRVTRTIGRRGLQEYVGIEVGRAEPVEVRLPLGWWPRRGDFYPQPYLDPWLGDEASFDAYAPVHEPWAERCPWCHSTYPFGQRIARASRPEPIGHGLEQYFASAPGSETLEVASQVTTGISCESCHLGGRAHAAGAPIHFVPIGASAKPEAPVVTTFADERRDPAIVNTVCAQCHSGPSPRFPDGGATRNSSEALDLAAGPCTGLTCTMCHDPHRADSRGDHARAIAACTGCHTELSDPAAARVHSGHDRVDCLDCHMPKMVMGIDRFVRSHRISSPTNRAMLAAGAPNACNLCHLDRSIAWTLEELQGRYHQHIELPASPYGRLDRPVGEVWLSSKQPAIRMLAAAAYARSPLGKAALPELIRGLEDPLPHVRAWAAFAVEEVLGTPLGNEYDVRASTTQRANAIRHVRTRLVGSD